MSIVIYYYNAGCGGVVFVDEDAVVIDAPTGDDCVWKIETETDRILAFSAVGDGSFQQLDAFLNVIL